MIRNDLRKSLTEAYEKLAYHTGRKDTYDGWRQILTANSGLPLALELAIPFFFVLAGGYQEPMEEKLVPLHVRTFEIAAKTKHLATT